MGRVDYRDDSDLFGIRGDDERRHIALFGQTGCGKSTLMENLIAADIAANQGLAVCDPHGARCNWLHRCVAN